MRGWAVLLPDAILHTVGAARVRGVVHDGLQRGFVAFRHHSPPNERMRRAIKGSYDGAPLFVCPTTVSNASTSTVSTAVGVGGASGSRSAAALPHVITG